MPRGGLRSTSFKPGVSGNPGGRPKKPQTIAARRAIADVKALARECAPEAIATLEKAVLSPKVPWPSRIQAASILLDRGYGKPAQKIDVTAILGALDLSKLSDGQLAQMELLIGVAAGSVIDHDAPSETLADAEALSEPAGDDAVE